MDVAGLGFGSAVASPVREPLLVGEPSELLFTGPGFGFEFAYVTGGKSLNLDGFVCMLSAVSPLLSVPAVFPWGDRGFELAYVTGENSLNLDAGFDGGFGAVSPLVVPATDLSAALFSRAADSPANAAGIAIMATMHRCVMMRVA